eukprot:TRINITY_DN3552_c0_g4_i1.p1 TRINITY_DN3552_c0_g4~~TRINITY_DN3552_c0_g4_i1.p1  ORF type:complete len:393 (+),score=77.03 TRINITY_DN3552_c0_g4_i1:42-1181(+)
MRKGEGTTGGEITSRGQLLIFIGIVAFTIVTSVFFISLQDGGGSKANTVLLKDTTLPTTVCPASSMLSSKNISYDSPVHLAFVCNPDDLNCADRVIRSLESWLLFRFWPLHIHYVATEQITVDFKKQFFSYDEMARVEVTYYSFDVCLKELSSILPFIDERTTQQACTLALPWILGKEVEHVLVMNTDGWVVQKSAYLNCWLGPFSDMDSWPPGEHLIGLVSSRLVDSPVHLDTGFVWLHLTRIRNAPNAAAAASSSLKNAYSLERLKQQQPQPAFLRPGGVNGSATLLNYLIEREPQLLHRLPCGCNYQITVVMNENERRRCKWTKQVYIAQKSSTVVESNVPLREKSLLDVPLFTQTLHDDPSLFIRLNPFNQPIAV